jgi:hypothetical protein
MNRRAKVLRMIVIALSAAAIAITVLPLTACLKLNLRRSERYVTGVIRGSLQTLLQTEYHFITFDKNYREIRKEPVDRYLLKYFTISVNPNEEYIHIFNSRYSPGTRNRLYEEVWLWPQQNLQSLNASGETRIPDLFVSKSVALKKPIHNSSHSKQSLVFSWRQNRHADAYLGTIKRTTDGKAYLSFVAPKDRADVSLSEILDSKACSSDATAGPEIDALCHTTSEGFELAEGVYTIEVIAYKYNTENQQMEQMTINNSSHPFAFRLMTD